MRSRISEYHINTSREGYVIVWFGVPSEKFYMHESFEGRISDGDYKILEDAIRLIADETAGITFCATMLKQNITDCYATGDEDEEFAVEVGLEFAIPSGKTVSSTDRFTIEVDWGKSIEELSEELSDQHQGILREYRQSAGSIVMATAAECAAALSDLSSRIDALDEDEDESES